LAAFGRDIVVAPSTPQLVSGSKVPISVIDAINIPVRRCGQGHTIKVATRAVAVVAGANFKRGDGVPSVKARFFMAGKTSCAISSIIYTRAFVSSKVGDVTLLRIYRVMILSSS
jgi:hypothetical protein